MVYAISDIHGFSSVLQDWVNRIGMDSLIAGTNKLILLGDYIDRGPNSYAALKLAYDLYQKCNGNVIVLRGNHEEWFLDFLDKLDDVWLAEDCNLNTSKSFLSNNEMADVEKIAEAETPFDFDGYNYIRNAIKRDHKELIAWMKKLPYFYKTKTQIYVHAGVDEEAGDWWEWGTSENIFLGKYPPETGKFYMDIIAGHISAYSISGEKSKGVFFDGQSHFYIDGCVDYTGKLLCLAYDEDTGMYYDVDETGKHAI